MSLQDEQGLLDLAEAAAVCALELAFVQHLADSGVVAPRAGYGMAELVELRRARRLMQDLELDMGAVEIVLRMRRRMLFLQRELRRVEGELLMLRRARQPESWIEAVVLDLSDDGGR